MTDIGTHKIKSYVLRTGRFSKLQRNSIEKLSELYCLPFREEKLDFRVIFGNDNPVIIEIGFGMGHATVEIAEANPDNNYIGIEVHTPGVGKLLSEINIRKLSNLLIIRHDAVQVIRDMIPAGSLNGVHIFFPDPWPKKKHHKRRLIKHEFIENLLPILKSNGYIYIVTDWEDYAEQIIMVLNEFSELRNPYTTYASGINWRPVTGFEKKGIESKHTIRDIWVELVDKT